MQEYQVTASEAQKSVKSFSRRRLRRELGAWGFMAPHLFFFIVFTMAPLVFGFIMSFHRWTLLDEPLFIGWDNFVRVWRDSRFWQAVSNTLIFALISVPLTMLVSLVFALLLNQKWYGKLWLLVAFVSPTFFGSVGILTTWRWVLSSAPNGLVNYYLSSIGVIKQPVSWFTTATMAWVCIIGVTVWWIVGFSVLLYLGALRRIPPEQYEAAKIDGAGPFERFVHVTLPWMRNVLFFDTVRQVLLAFGLFDQVYFFTGGGPAGATRTMVYYLFEVGFQRQQLGRAAAISWYIFIVVFGFALIQLFILTKSIRSAEE
ncbi:carbohydrate ABC transporter permease [Pseudothermotoga thermarum]|uniref:Carbohydrate ABC transporter membrane protein 1, CUT1 family n=1 Tax=Pseudothermotoga thermarum DSM 5069 TaxID=688269 RepID=F7YTI7_9THEM|nr:sugar ABC transporter permease [Pseudothermotoga thermarum]AEH51201.1 carbohydrate ABC transporter membrane protein 1, CUT1 family [Pseudothermotoga thermarum DSM 5069]